MRTCRPCTPRRCPIASSGRGPGSFAAADVLALLAKPENRVLLARVGAEPAGYAVAEIMCRPETPLTHAHAMIHVHHLSVAPRFRRRGIGGALLGAVRAAGLDEGIALLTLDVWSFNEPARAFFRQQGLSPYIERLWSR